MNPKIYFVYMSNREVSSPNSCTTLWNDLAWSIKDKIKGNSEVLTAQDIDMVSNGDIVVNSYACHPSNTVFIFDGSSYYESILLYKGFQGINYSWARDLASNRLFTMNFLKDSGLRVPDFTLSKWRNPPSIVRSVTERFRETKYFTSIEEWNEFKIGKALKYLMFQHIKNRIQCDYKIYTFLGKIILGILLRVNPKYNSFTPDTDNFITVPIYPPIGFDDMMITLKSSEPMYGKKLKEEWRYLNTDEKEVIRDAFAQENISLSNGKVDIDTDTFAPARIALKTSELMNLGLAEVQIVTDMLKVPHVLDVSGHDVNSDVSLRFYCSNMCSFLAKRVAFE